MRAFSVTALRVGRCNSSCLRLALGGGTSSGQRRRLVTAAPQLLLAPLSLHYRRRHRHRHHPVSSALTRSLFSPSNSSDINSSDGDSRNTQTAAQLLESSLEAQLSAAAEAAAAHNPSSSVPLSFPPSSLPLVRQLLDVYTSQHRYEEAERLLWRLCDEQTRGGATTTAADGSGEKKSDEDTVEALRTMAAILGMRRLAAERAAQRAETAAGSSSSSSDVGVADDLFDRYTTLTAAAASAVIDHPINGRFITALARIHVDSGDAAKAERVLRSALLFDEQTHTQTQPAIAQLSEGGRLRHAVAYNFLGLVAYDPPPAHVHSEACSDGHHHHHHHDDQAQRNYDWSESERRWRRALELLDPVVARLTSSNKSPAATSALFTPDSLALHALQTYTRTEDNLADALQSSGREEEAIATLQRYIAALSAMMPSHNSELIHVRHNLAILHLSSGNAAAAQKECEPILALDPQLLSPDQSPLLTHLGHAFFDAHHPQHAARVFQLCVSSRDAAATTAVSGAATTGNGGSGNEGDVDLVTAARLNDLAMCELRLRNHAAAEQHLRRCVAIKDRVLGADHWESAVSVHNLGTALMALRRYEDAEAQLQRAAALYEAKYAHAPQHDGARETALGVLAAHLGQCYALMERWTDAVVAYERAVDMKTRALGDHASVAMDLTQMGGALLRAGAYTDAVSAYERVRAMAERLHGAEDTNVAVALHWQAVAEGRVGRRDAAVQHSRQAVELGERLHAAGSMKLNTLEVLRRSAEEQSSAAAAGATEAQGRSGI